jgi:hypothetical protein
MIVLLIEAVREKFCLVKCKKLWYIKKKKRHSLGCRLWISMNLNARKLF